MTFVWNEASTQRTPTMPGSSAVSAEPSIRAKRSLSTS